MIFHHNVLFLSAPMYLRPLYALLKAERNRKYPHGVIHENIQREIIWIQIWPRENSLMLTTDIYMDYFHNPIHNEDFFFTVESIPNQMSCHSEHFSVFFFSN